MDGLGSLRQMTNIAGVLQYLASYDPFGSPFEAYNAVADSSIGFGYCVAWADDRRQRPTIPPRSLL